MAHDSAGHGGWPKPQHNNPHHVFIMYIVNMLHIELLTASESAAERLREIRLRSLEDAPDAFGSTLEETRARPRETWLQQVQDVPAYLAVQHGDDVGIVRYAQDNSRADTVWLISMWVAPEVRGSGAGDALMKAVVAGARAAGAKRMLLDVADNNRHAIALYQRHGFAANGETSTLPPPRGHVKEHQRELQLE